VEGESKEGFSGMKLYMKIRGLKKYDYGWAFTGNNLEIDIEEAKKDKKLREGEKEKFVYVDTTSVAIHPDGLDGGEEMQSAETKFGKIKQLDFVEIEDVKGEKTGFQIGKIFKKEKDVYVFGWIVGEWQNYSKLEGTKYAGRIHIEAISKIITAVPEKNDMNGREVKVGDIVVFEVPSGEKFYKKITRIELVGSRYKLWGNKPLTDYMKVKNQKKDEECGAAIASMVEIC
jgi:hypothetical protein